MFAPRQSWLVPPLLRANAGGKLPLTPLEHLAQVVDQRQHTLVVVDGALTIAHKFHAVRAWFDRHDDAVGIEDLEPLDAADVVFRLVAHASASLHWSQRTRFVGAMDSRGLRFW